MQALCGICFRKRLMFVLIVPAKINLGNLLWRETSIDFRQGAHLQTPVIGYVDGPGKAGQKAELPGQGITKGAMIAEELLKHDLALVVHDLDQGCYQWGYEKPCGSSLHLLLDR